MGLFAGQFGNSAEVSGPGELECSLHSIECSLQCSLPCIAPVPATMAVSKYIHRSSPGGGGGSNASPSGHRPWHSERAWVEKSTFPGALLVLYVGSAPILSLLGCVAAGGESLPRRPSGCHTSLLIGDASMPPIHLLSGKHIPPQQLLGNSRVLVITFLPPFAFPGR